MKKVRSSEGVSLAMGSTPGSFEPVYRRARASFPESKLRKASVEILMTPRHGEVILNVQHCLRQLNRGNGFSTPSSPKRIRLARTGASRFYLHVLRPKVLTVCGPDSPTRRGPRRVSSTVDRLLSFSSQERAAPTPVACS